MKHLIKVTIGMICVMIASMAYAGSASIYIKNGSPDPVYVKATCPIDKVAAGTEQAKCITVDLVSGGTVPGNPGNVTTPTLVGTYQGGDSGQFALLITVKDPSGSYAVFTYRYRSPNYLYDASVRLGLLFPEDSCDGIAIGASIAIDGVCLTVVKQGQNVIEFDVMNETLERTTLSTLAEGSSVNFERSARVGDEIGGHLVSGHVHGTAEVVKLMKPLNNHILFVKIAKPWMEYIASKGFITLNGASLTVVDVEHKTNSFSVHLIPETLDRTTFADKTLGHKINFEIDQNTLMVVDTVKRYLKEKH